MSTDKGYIKLYRDIRDHEIWQEKPFDRARAWIDLIMMVNHEDKKILFDGEPVPVYRGSVITSARKLADRWGWSRGKVERFLSMLESEIMIRQDRTRKRAMISIVNYDVYQTSQTTKRATEKPLNDHRRTTDGHKQYTKEDTKEGTKKNNVPFGEVIDEVGNPWDEEGWE